MSSFRVDTSAFDRNIPKIAKIKNRMGAIQNELSKITSHLDWEIKGQQQMNKKLTQLQSEFDTLNWESLQKKLRSSTERIWREMIKPGRSSPSHASPMTRTATSSRSSPPTVM